MLLSRWRKCFLRGYSKEVPLFAIPDDCRCLYLSVSLCVSLFVFVPCLYLSVSLCVSLFVFVPGEETQHGTPASVLRRECCEFGR